MNGQELLSRMKRLGEVDSVKQVTQLTTAMFPGPHCPLMGAMMAVRGIRDGVMLVVGTDECTYYTKNTTIGNSAFGGLDGRCLSVVLDQHDVTFGCRETLYDAVEELMAEYHPKAVFVVTTCVVEVIGDDVDSMAEELSERHGVPVLPVHTEHFKTENHLPGVRDTITACFELMEKQPLGNAVNIIGQRLGDFRETELYRVLSGAGVPMGMMLPSGTVVEEIRQAPAARVNIVVNPIGLPLAEKMKRAFGTPYVLFDKYIDPEQIYRLYQELFAHLGLPVPDEVEDLYQQAIRAVAQAEGQLEGLTYIYGNTPIECFAFNAFMVGLGMRPLLIQTSQLPERDDPDRQRILERCDPYVTKTANIAPLQYIYDVLRPNLYLGHEFAARLREKGIEMVHSDRLSSMLGLEVTLAGVTELLRAGRAARALREGRESA